MIAKRIALLLPAVLLAACGSDPAGEDRSLSRSDLLNAAMAPEEPAWDGQPIRETDAVITLALPAPPASIQLNGTPATTFSGSDPRRVKVLIPSDASGTRCENTFVVAFAERDPGTLLANHCHGDRTFAIRPGEIVNALLTKEDVDDPADDLPPPGEGLEFEWSANGYEQLPAHYQWQGGTSIDTGEAYVLLAVPETDDMVASGTCRNGRIVTDYFFMPDRDSGTIAFLMEVGGANPTREYQAPIVSDAMGARYQLKQAASDPVFAEIGTGEWLYIRIGDASSRTKYRIALKGAAKAFAPLLASCRG
jgi:hypothetical protein